jgi:hypothetical protein
MENCAMTALMKLINRALHGKSAAAKAAESAEFSRSTDPQALMDVLLRFETAFGPRTIVAPGVSLAMASEIAFVMSQAGHFAEFVDHIPSVSVHEHVKRRKAQARTSEVVSLKWAKAHYPRTSNGRELH